MNRKLDPAAHRVIFRVLATGGTLKMAADAVGCSRSAIYAAADREPEFRKAIKQFQSQSKTDSLMSLADAAKENAQFAYKRLRMLYPDDYARKADTIPVKHAREVMDRFVDGIIGEVRDPAALERIKRCLSRSKRDVRERKSPKGEPTQIDGDRVPKHIEGECPQS
jgi:hypothetical protein